MGRRAKNRYRLSIGGAKLEVSLLKDFCDESTDFEKAEEILRHFRFFNSLENLRNGASFELKLLRASKAKKD